MELRFAGVVSVRLAPAVLPVTRLGRVTPGATRRHRRRTVWAPSGWCLRDPGTTRGPPPRPLPARPSTFFPCLCLPRYVSSLGVEVLVPSPGRATKEDGVPNSRTSCGWWIRVSGQWSGWGFGVVAWLRPPSGLGHGGSFRRDERGWGSWGSTSVVWVQVLVFGPLSFIRNSLCLVSVTEKCTDRHYPGFFTSPVHRPSQVRGRGPRPTATGSVLSALRPSPKALTDSAVRVLARTTAVTLARDPGPRRPGVVGPLPYS